MRLTATHVFSPGTWRWDMLLYLRPHVGLLAVIFSCPVSQHAGHHRSRYVNISKEVLPDVELPCWSEQAMKGMQLLQATMAPVKDTWFLQAGVCKMRDYRRRHTKSS